MPIDESVIAHMNELLIELSDDAELSREERYTQQQRLRTAISHPVSSIKKKWTRGRNS
jgi:hypothetical protein